MKGKVGSSVKKTAWKLRLLIIPMFFLLSRVLGQCPPKVIVFSPYPAPGVTYPAATSGLKSVFNVIPNNSSTVNYTHTFTFAPMTSFTIKFGDGSNDYIHNGLAVSTVQHTYTTHGLFVYEIINNDCTQGASATGNIYSGKDTDPMILGAGFPPTDNYCLPNTLIFQNNSLGMSPFYEYDWDFGDTPAATYDTTLSINNGIGTIGHKYTPAYASCKVYVKFRVRKILPGSFFEPFIQTGGPYNFLTMDVPKINKPEVVLCTRGVNQDVELTDVSALNCLATAQRKIRWDIIEEPTGKVLTKLSGTFGSEINYSVAANKKIKVRVPSSAINGDEFKIRLIINNECGKDTSFSTIKVLNPVKPSFVSNTSLVCPGRKASFTNTSADRTNLNYDYYWDIYNQANVKVWTLQSDNVTVEIPLILPGTYKVILRARVTSYVLSGTAPFCEDISDPQYVIVNQNVVSQIQLPQESFCTSVGIFPTVALNNNSLNENSTTRYQWFISAEGGDTLTFSKMSNGDSKTTTFTPSSYGRYIVKLEADDASNVCTKTTDLDTFYIYNQSTPLLKSFNACVGSEVVLRDSSRVFDIANKGFPDDAENLKVSIDFRDGSPIYSYVRNDKGACTSGTNLLTTNKLSCTRVTHHTYTNPGKYWVKFTIQNSDLTNYCSVTDSVLVEVYPVQPPSFDKSNDGCAPLNVALKNLIPSPAISGTNYIWNINGVDLKRRKAESADLDTVFSKSGDYKIILKAVSPNGCVASSVEQKVKVFNIPQFQISSNYETFLSKCSPLNLTFITDINSTSLSSIESATFTYFEDDKLINSESITSITKVADLQRTKKITNTSFTQKKFKTVLSIKYKEGGCVASRETEFVVDPRPLVEFAMDKNDGCSPLSIQFSIDSSKVDPSTQYIWNFPGGSQLTSNNPQPPVITFVNKGNIPVVRTIRLTTMTAQGCSDYFEKIVTVYPETLPKFVIVNNKKVCSDEKLKFENKSTGGAASKYIWIWGDGSKSDTTTNISESVWHSFKNASLLSDTLYEVKLLAIANCVAHSDIRTVEVEKRLKSGFSINVNSNCSPATITLSSESYGAVNSYTWKIDSEKLIAKTGTVVHILNNTTNKPKEYNVTLIANSLNGCIDSLTKTITLHPQLKTAFSFKNLNDNRCSPANYKFVNITSGDAEGYVWDFGDGVKDTVLTKEEVTHTFVNPGTSQITYRVTLTSLTSGDCGTFSFSDIQIAPSSVADFAMKTEGCSPFEVVFENRSAKSDVLEWDFGNGTVYTGTNPPNQIYLNITSKPVIKEIKLRSIAKGGCEDVISKNLIVHPQPLPSFRVESSPVRDLQSTIGLINTSSEGEWKYEWDFGDGEKSISNNPGSHKYKRAGNYVVTLKLSNDFCEKSFSTSVRIAPLDPIANFTQDVVKGCRPLTVNFRNLSEDADSTKYLWEFGDGLSRSQQVNPFYTYNEPGIYTVKLVAYNLEGDKNEVIKEQLIEITDVPYASFIQNRNIVHIPEEEVSFTNLSQNASSYFWDFGDGNFSYDKNPVYAYSDTGRFTITMVAISPNGCSDTTVIRKAVLATAEGSIKVPNAFTPSLIGASSRSISSEGLNDVFYPIVEGAIDIEIKVYNRWGEMVYSCRGMDCAGWNGYYKGKLCKQDVYIYNIKAKLGNGEVVEKVGDVMVLN